MNGAIKIQFVLLLLFAACSGCALTGNKSLDILTYTDSSERSNENLIIFLRGLGGTHHSFADEGLVEELRKRDLPFDMVAPNTHFGYYWKRTLAIRLTEDVILPAIEKGYTNIWLVGISMGGLGSLLFVREQSQYIKGVYLISPFLGYDEIIDEIVGSEGVAGWNPGEYDLEDDWERMIWHWIKDEVPLNTSVPIFLGYGLSDKYGNGQRLFASTLPKEKVISIAGGHDFQTFRSLWSNFLESGYLQGTLSQDVRLQP